VDVRTKLGVPLKRMRCTRLLSRKWRSQLAPAAAGKRLW